MENFLSARNFQDKGIQDAYDYYEDDVLVGVAVKGEKGGLVIVGIDDCEQCDIYALDAEGNYIEDSWISSDDIEDADEAARLMKEYMKCF